MPGRSCLTATLSRVKASVAQDLARLDRLPVWPWPRRLLFNLGGSFFFAFFDIVVIVQSQGLGQDQETQAFQP